MDKKIEYGVPEGYFEGLEQRLSAIPRTGGKRNAASRLSPYLALAACMILSVILGNALLRKTASPKASDEEVIEYLINSDISLAQLMDIYYNNQ